MGNRSKRKKQLINHARELSKKNSKKMKLRSGSTLEKKKPTPKNLESVLKVPKPPGPSIPREQSIVLARAALDKKRANEKSRNLRGELNLLKSSQNRVRFLTN